MKEQRTVVYIGSYADKEGPGIYVCELNTESGALTVTQSLDGFANPTFLNIDQDKQRVYSIGEMFVQDKKVGEVSTFAIKQQTGKLELLARVKSVDSTTCHIQRDKSSSRLTVTSYHGGMVGVLPIDQDGQAGIVSDVAQHSGSSVDPERQDRPHPHSSFYSPDEKYLLVQDLGLDQIIVYLVDKDNNALAQHQTLKLHDGAGPRHLVFHPNGKFAYVINELDSTVTTLGWDGQNGRLTVLQTISTLPDNVDAENGCAEIAISACGRFVYGSNRGHDSIVVYEVNADSGQLKLVQHISSGGGHPRHFALTADGKFVLVANRDANNVVTFRRDEHSGKLEQTSEQLELSKPVCVWPVLV